MQVPFLSMVFFGLLVVLGLPGAAAAVPTDVLTEVLSDPDADAAMRGDAVARAADAADAGFGDSRSSVRMVLHDGRGRTSERALRIQVLEGRDGEGDRSLILFDSPPDQRGTALLTWNHDDADDDQWLFLPALRRVKKIAARNRSGPFVGSEFAFEDLTAEAPGAFDWSFLGVEACDPDVADERGPEGADGAAASPRCYRVERRPVEAWSGYTRQVAWYDTRALRLVRVDYFDRKDAHLKTLVASDWRRSPEGFWRAGYMDMRNHQSSRRTELFWSPHAFGTGLGAQDFTTNALRRSR